MTARDAMRSPNRLEAAGEGGALLYHPGVRAGADGPPFRGDGSDRPADRSNRLEVVSRTSRANNATSDQASIVASQLPNDNTTPDEPNRSRCGSPLERLEQTEVR